MNRLIILHAVKPLTLGDEVHWMVLLPKPIRIVIIYIFSKKPEWIVLLNSNESLL